MIDNKFGRRSASAAVLAPLLLWPAIAYGQVIPSQSQIPPGEQVERRTPDAQLSIRVGGVLAAPEGADKVSIKVASFVTDGGFDPITSSTAKLLPQTGAQLSLADIYRIAGEVQQAYLDAGYPLVRVFVPTQDLDRANAQITLRIVSGFVGRIDVEALDPHVRKTVRRYLSKLINRPQLKADVLERAVLLAGDVSGVTLSSALTPGNQTGETVLIASGKYSPVQAVLSVDNRLSRELGREQTTASFAFNSVLGLGERIGTTVSTAADNISFGPAALRRYFGVFVDLPVGNDGLIFGFDASTSTARPRGTAAFLALSSRFVHAGGTLTYPVIRSRTARLLVTASFDANQEIQESLLLGFPVPLSRDETRVGRFGISGNKQFLPGTFVAAGLEYSRGLNVLGARTANNASIFEPLSRIGADAVFNKLTGQASIEATLPETPLTARINMRGQVGFGTPLLRSEQFSLMAPDLISGPPTGSVVGDTGYAVRYQLEGALPVIKVRIAPYAFGAFAGAILAQPTPFELRRTDVTAYGTGVRAAAPIVDGFSISAQLEYSRTQSDDPNARGDWLTFQVSLRY